LRWLDGRKLDGVIHMGAISSTTETDGDAVMDNNFRLSLKLLDWCTDHRTPFIYASSAATYGNGETGFSDALTRQELTKLKPMNLYGWSKHLFDLALLDRVEKKQKLPPQWAGLKFFNVFGPNEYHKGEMMSLLAKRFDEAKAGKPIRLFKSDRAGIADGEQKRDFVCVEDAVSVVLWLLKSEVSSGIFNVGTGTARSFKDLMSAMFVALGKAPSLEYIDMPPALHGTYQYFTQADVAKLQRAGYNAGFTPLEDAVRSYVTQYLDREDRYR
jgi:ADP-L-glycero-D-manno-heptose 6-epimerase